MLHENVIAKQPMLFITIYNRVPNTGEDMHMALLFGRDRYAVAKYRPSRRRVPVSATSTDFGRYRLRSVRRRQIQAEPKANACIGDKYRSQPVSTKKQCHMHFIVRPPTCLTDN